ncbi:hypothetical protein DRH27_00035 [Candidatus Falkowbacteria bacterium]|nr:MAG: hypothetical protein DRH27_00035 [Candidatus Falkowbacteria bacterium]
MITLITKDKCMMFDMSSYKQELDLVCTLSGLKDKGKSTPVKIKVRENMDSAMQEFTVIPKTLDLIKLEYRRYQPEIGDEIENLLNNLPKMEKKNDKESEEE